MVDPPPSAATCAGLMQGLGERCPRWRAGQGPGPTGPESVGVGLLEPDPPADSPHRFGDLFQGSHQVFRGNLPAGEIPRARQTSI